MMKHKPLRINNWRDRSVCCGILANAGYTVRVEEKPPKPGDVGTDYFVVIEEEAGSSGVKPAAAKVVSGENGNEYCPNCSKKVKWLRGFSYCADCGQRLDWGDI